MIRTLLKSLLAFTACLYLGGSHLAFLQVVAWSGMLVTNTAQQGLGAGWRDTFSGEKPCPMCKAISAARSQEASDRGDVPAPAPGMKKIWTEMLPSPERPQPRWAAGGQRELGFPSVLLPPGAAAARPPVPPPRAAPKIRPIAIVG